MISSTIRTRTLTVLSVAVGALALGTSGVTASAATRTARATTGNHAPSLTVKKPRKGVTAWRTQRVANPSTSAVEAVIATAGN